VEKINKNILPYEIELLKSSQDTDKFNLNNVLTVYLGIIPLIASISFIFFVPSDGVICFLFAYLIISIYFIIFHFIPLRNRFNRKQKMMRKRYKKLGISVEALGEELKNTSLDED
jgi:hypothetical protein